MMTMDPRAKLLYDHWRSVCGDERVPLRQEMNPARFRDILGNVFILDWKSTSDVRFRLAGSSICDSFGMELRGMNALALWEGEARARLRQLLHRVVTEPCVGHAVGVQKNERGDCTDFEILLLPLKQTDGSLKQIMGCKVVMQGDGTNAHSLPVVSQWIDGIAVYHVPVADSFQSFQDSIMPFQYGSVPQTDTRPLQDHNPVIGAKPDHPFKVIEGGLSRK